MPGFYDAGPGSWDEAPDYTADLYQMLNSRPQRQVMTTPTIANLPPIDTSMPQQQAAPQEDEDSATISAIGGALSGIVGAYGMSGGMGATGGTSPLQGTTATPTAASKAGSQFPIAGRQGGNVPASQSFVNDPAFNSLSASQSPMSVTQPAPAQSPAAPILSALSTPTAPTGSSVLKTPVASAPPSATGWYEQTAPLAQVTDDTENRVLLSLLLGHGGNALGPFQGGLGGSPYIG